MSATVYMTVSGLTGSGKSAVMGEIEIALKAIGIPVEHDVEFQSEKNMTHADWQSALDLYKPTVVLKEANVPRLSANSEPVAWRARHSISENWHYFDTPVGWWECQPLYPTTL